MILKTHEQITRFINPNEEWVEDTPFYKKGYLSTNATFQRLHKVTRVVAFISDKEDYADELKELVGHSLNLGFRDDLRIAKVIDRRLVKRYKEEYQHLWFQEFSSSSVVLFRKNETFLLGNLNHPLVSYYDLATRTDDVSIWMNKASVNSVENLNEESYEIVTSMSTSFIILFIDPYNPYSGEDSYISLENLKKVQKLYPRLQFFYCDSERFRRAQFGIDWKESPSMTIIRGLSSDKYAFPQD